jgi:putative DNA primase/helicase
MTDNLIRDVVTLANGQWLSILNNLCGEILYKKAKPCPACGGNDRFTFDDKEGRGTYVCRGCGSGDGLSLVAKLHSINARQAALMVAPYVGLSIGQSVDTAAIERNRCRAEQAKAQEVAKLANKQGKAAVRALAILKTCKPALASNAYLNAKQVQPFGTFELTKAVHLYGDFIMDKGSLVVPTLNPILSGVTVCAT